jgi:hypothetical protein
MNSLINDNIYKLYDILILLKINNIFKTLKDISNNINKFKTEYKIFNIYKFINILNYDLKSLIINNYYNTYYLEKIKNVKNMKLLNNLQIKTFNNQYFFKNKISITNTNYNILLNNINNIINISKYKFIITNNDTTNIIGIKCIDDKITLFQFNYFGKILYKFLINDIKIILNDQEKLQLFTATTINTVPTIYTVYLARNHIIKNIKFDNHNDYLKEIIKYVRFYGYNIVISRQNNRFVMNLIN